MVTSRSALRRARHLGFAGLLAAAMTVAVATPTSAGANFSIEGEAVCDTTTGEYVVTWSLINVGFDTEVISAIQTPGGDITATVTPNPIPPDTTAIATGRAPGTTQGSIVLVVEDDQALEVTGEVEVEGTCTATPPPAPIEVEPIRFTG
jgi:hypothetical protein